MNTEQLRHYISSQMRMSHVYQPVMLRELLKSNGEATVEQIAKALLSHDRSQVEIYEIRTKNMVGKVLTNNGVVVPIKNGSRIVGYRLNDLEDIEAEDRELLVAKCEEKIADYIERRGSDIWQHRFNAKGYVPGSIRYEVLKRAKYRCELCGASAEDVALHVDHIIPRNKGGQDDLSNFQSLCITCNTNKRDQDDADYQHDFETSEACFEMAHNLHPNSADILLDQSDALGFIGPPDHAWQLFEQALDLNPMPPEHYWWAGASIAFSRAEYAHAVELCDRLENDEPVMRLLAACHGHLGNTAEARDYGRRLREI